MMSRFRKKPVVVEATQWFKNGDHPQDQCRLIEDAGNSETGELAPPFLSEGRVVRYFRHPDDPGYYVCPICRKLMQAHGWLDTPEGGSVVCPGDWIITGVQGEHYQCKPDIFEATYELADSSASAAVSQSPAS